MTNERYGELMESGAAVSPQEHSEGCEYGDLLMQLGEMGCQCALWKPVSMARCVQERSMPAPLNDGFAF